MSPNQYVISSRFSNQNSSQFSGPRDQGVQGRVTGALQQDKPEGLKGINADGFVFVAVVAPDGDDDVLAEPGLLLEGGAARRLQALPRVGRGGRGERRGVKMARRS